MLVLHECICDMCTGVTWIYLCWCYMNVSVICVRVLPGSICVGVT